jgi:hypothetical protein
LWKSGISLKNGETLKVWRHQEASFRHSGGCVSFQFGGELARVGSPGEICLKRGRNALHLLRGFVHKLEAKMANSHLAPRIHVRTGLLRLRAKNRVTTANIGDHRMRAAFSIPQSHSMLLAGPAAIAIRSAARKEPAEDAMLGVEDWQMLVSNGFQPLGANAFG